MSPVPTAKSAASADGSTHPKPVRTNTAAIAGLTLLVGLGLGLAYFKWGTSAHTVATTAASGSLNVSASPYFASPLASTAAYLKKVGIALTFGILIGGTLRVVVSPAKVADWLGGRGARGLLRGALIGAPLMLCACCVTPVFSGLHRRGARLGPSLSVLFAAPALNVASLVITCMVFPAKIGVLRILASLVLVFGLAPAVGRLFEANQRAKGAPETCPIEPEEPLSWQSFPRRWFSSVAHLTATTVPLVVAGVLVSAFVLPYIQAGGLGSPFVVVATTALLGVVIALPTFVEIPIALSLAAAGAPGPALAILIAGPVVNLPSLLVLGREVGPRVAAAIFVSIWVLATLFGWTVT